MQKINFITNQKCGIYSIFNLSNGKRYIGSSKNIYNRLHEHLFNLKNGKAHNNHLQAAWDKYGSDNFDFSVLEYCDITKQFEREQYYMDVMSPEYNLTPQVIASYNTVVSEATKLKISNTLKRKYANNEITSYRQEHMWKSCYIYNIYTLKLEVECKCLADAIKLVSNKKDTSLSEIQNHLYRNRYIITCNRFTHTYELENYINEFILCANSSKGKYIIIEDNSNLVYFRSLAECARCNFVSTSILTKNNTASKDSPYIIKKLNRKFYYSDVFIPKMETAVLIEESSELLQTNIGGKPYKENPEISTDIKASVPSYSVEIETTVVE